MNVKHDYFCADKTNCKLLDFIWAAYRVQRRWFNQDLLLLAGLDLLPGKVDKFPTKLYLSSSQANIPLHQVHLRQPAVPDLVTHALLALPSLGVHLYDVDTVLVDREVQLDRLTTAWEGTKLYINLATEDTSIEDHNFNIAGFKHSNIVFGTRANNFNFNKVLHYSNTLLQSSSKI